MNDRVTWLKALENKYLADHELWLFCRAKRATKTGRCAIWREFQNWWVRLPQNSKKWVFTDSALWRERPSVNTGGWICAGRATENSSAEVRFTLKRCWALAHLIGKHFDLKVCVCVSAISTLHAAINPLSSAHTHCSTGIHFFDRCVPPSSSTLYINRVYVRF